MAKLLDATNDARLVEGEVFLKADKQEVIKVALLGAAVGLLTPFLSFLIERFFIEPVFCHSTDSFGICASGGLTAYYGATVIMAIIAIVFLANWQVYRPLLIAVAAGATLWGLMKYASQLIAHNGFEYYLFSAILFAALYILFYWVMRLRSFVASVVAAVLLVTLIRWVLVV